MARGAAVALRSGICAGVACAAASRRVTLSDLSVARRRGREGQLLATPGQGWGKAGAPQGRAGARPLATPPRAAPGMANLKRFGPKFTASWGRLYLARVHKRKFEEEKLEL